MHHTLNKRDQYNAWETQTDEQEDLPQKLQTRSRSQSEKLQNCTDERRRQALEDYLELLHELHSMAYD